MAALHAARAAGSASGHMADVVPCWAALIQAAHGIPAVQQLALFTLGAFLMRSAGSTINDIADRRFDGHVERTRFRPLASGQIGMVPAIAFLAIPLALAASLLLFLTPYTRLIATCVLPKGWRFLVIASGSPGSRVTLCEEKHSSFRAK
ncbi:hypothetical protein X772_36650 [Mesorhizobium sp. LSJC280B00]|nr:hypothetical protein X772_36650 [Mesorhizobium sp. LSJC280B00]